MTTRTLSQTTSVPRSNYRRGRRFQSIQGAHYARRIVIGRKGLCEPRFRPPSRTVAGRDDPGLYACLQIAHGRLDTRLHSLARQMIAAEHHVEWHTGEMALGFQAGVDNTRVRTRREYGDPATPNHSDQKAFIHNERIGARLVAAEGVVTGKTGLIFGNPGNVVHNIISVMLCRNLCCIPKNLP